MHPTPLSSASTGSTRTQPGWPRPFEGWLDGIEAGWAIPLLLMAFVVLWVAFLAVAYSGAALHPDVLETWSLGRDFAWGGAKHPPLMGWVAYLWSLVFPLTDWSFQLLAMVNSAVALWAVDLISRRFVEGDKRAIVLLLLMLSPIYQFHAQRFNANAILLAIWPLATYCFLRSFESRRIFWSVAAGVLAAVAMLGKYYSVFLLGSFVVAAILHPQRALYFRSLAPWLSAVTGLAVLGPHLHWLTMQGTQPFDYALAIHSGNDLPRSIEEACMFILGLAAALALPMLAWLLMVEKGIKKIASDVRALNSNLVLLLLVFVATVFLPAAAAVAFGFSMPSLWAVQGLYLLPVLMVCGASFNIRRFHTVNLTVVVIVVALIAIVVAAPIHALKYNASPFKEGRNFYHAAAQELARQWRASSDAPFLHVGGDETLALATAFYASEHPSYTPSYVVASVTPAPDDLLSRQGWAGMCFQENNVCVASLKSIVSSRKGAVGRSFSVQASVWGKAGATADIFAVLIPPRIEEPAPIPEAPVESALEGVADSTPPPATVSPLAPREELGDISPLGNGG